jgi:hypothetical protein
MEMKRYETIKIVVEQEAQAVIHVCDSCGHETEPIEENISLLRSMPNGWVTYLSCKRNGAPKELCDNCVRLIKIESGIDLNGK